jgi:hypothetical protein
MARPRLSELRRRWDAAERRVAEAARGGPAWDAARAESDEIEAAYMGRLNRILDRSIARGERPPSL